MMLDICWMEELTFLLDEWAKVETVFAPQRSPMCVLLGFFLLVNDPGEFLSVKSLREYKSYLGEDIYSKS